MSKKPRSLEAANGDQEALKGKEIFNQPQIPASIELENRVLSHGVIREYVQACRMGFEQEQNRLIDRYSNLEFRRVDDAKAIALLTKSNLRDSKLYALLMDRIACWILKGFYNEKGNSSLSTPENLSLWCQSDMNKWSQEDFISLIGIIGALSVREQKQSTTAAECDQCRFHIHRTTKSCSQTELSSSKDDTHVSSVPRNLSVESAANAKKQSLIKQEDNAPVRDRPRRLQLSNEGQLCVISKSRSTSIVPESVIRSRRSPTVEAENPPSPSGPKAPQCTTDEASHNVLSISEEAVKVNEPDSFMLDELELFLDDFDADDYFELLASSPVVAHTSPNHALTAQDTPLAKHPPKFPTNNKEPQTTTHQPKDTKAAFSGAQQDHRKTPQKQKNAQPNHPAPKRKRSTTKASPVSQAHKAVPMIEIDSSPDKDTEHSFPKRKFPRLASPPLSKRQPPVQMLTR